MVFAFKMFKWLIWNPSLQAILTQKHSKFTKAAAKNRRIIVQLLPNELQVLASERRRVKHTSNSRSSELLNYGIPFEFLECSELEFG